MRRKCLLVGVIMFLSLLLINFLVLEFMGHCLTDILFNWKSYLWILFFNIGVSFMASSFVLLEE